MARGGLIVSYDANFALLITLLSLCSVYSAIRKVQNHFPGAQSAVCDRRSVLDPGRFPTRSFEALLTHVFQ